MIFKDKRISLEVNRAIFMPFESSEQNAKCGILQPPQIDHAGKRALHFEIIIFIFTTAITYCFHRLSAFTTGASRIANCFLLLSSVFVDAR